MTALETTLLVALVVAVLLLIYGQIRALRALGEAAIAVRALSEEFRGQGTPLLQEARAAMAEATQAAARAGEAAEAARAAAESLQGVAPLLEELRPVARRAAAVVEHADETVVDARATVGAAQRVLAQVEDTVARLRVSDLALDLLKSRSGDAGRLAASAGQLVKSMWQRRSDKPDDPRPEADSPVSEMDGTTSHGGAG